MLSRYVIPAAVLTVVSLASVGSAANYTSDGNTWWCIYSEVAIYSTHTVYEIEECEGALTDQYVGSHDQDYGDCSTPDNPGCIWAPSTRTIPMLVSKDAPRPGVGGPTRVIGRVIDRRKARLIKPDGTHVTIELLQIEKPASDSRPLRILGLAHRVADDPTAIYLMPQQVKSDGNRHLISIGNVNYCLYLQ